MKDKHLYFYGSFSGLVVFVIFIGAMCFQNYKEISNIEQRISTKHDIKDFLVKVADFDIELAHSLKSRLQGNYKKEFKGEDYRGLK